MRTIGLNEGLVRIWETGFSLRIERRGQWKGKERNIDTEDGGGRFTVYKLREDEKA